MNDNNTAKKMYSFKMPIIRIEIYEMADFMIHIDIYIFNNCKLRQKI